MRAYNRKTTLTRKLVNLAITISLPRITSLFLKTTHVSERQIWGENSMMTMWTFRVLHEQTFYKHKITINKTINRYLKQNKIKWSLFLACDRRNLRQCIMEIHVVIIHLFVIAPFILAKLCNEHRFTHQYSSIDE